MSTAVHIRKAEADDARRLATIGFLAWESSILPLLTEVPGMRAAEQRRLASAVHETIDRVIVAEVDGVAVGWCSRSRGRAYIPFLFVAPEFQNHGVGQLLLSRMETLIELEGAERVYLETPADNVRAVKFYEHRGYRILAMRPDGRPDHRPFMSVRLEKLLHPFVGRVSDTE
ncbi:MAG TPA: GNAT family N-acetyltransferase [Devosiaceae bacterium]|jgi:2-amino-4-hydroxy-6-hydroxymethyldihydropteridine diphosphokinase